MNFSIYEVMVLSFVKDLLEEQNNVLVSIFKNIQREIYKEKFTKSKWRNKHIKEW